MGETADLWAAMNEIKERVTRIEERSTNRDEKITDMASKVGEMHHFFVQTQGGIKTANAMVKYAYGAGGAVFVFIASNWQAVKKLF